MRTRKSWSFVTVLTVLVAAGLALPDGAETRDVKGYLYLNQYFTDAQIEEMGMVAPAEFYLYKVDGTLIHSGYGTGSHKPGQRVALEPGEYLIEVGTHRTRHNLQKISVTGNKVTVIPTGWVSVLTWRPENQHGCENWDAELRAVVVSEDGKEHLISTNASKRHRKGMLQLPVGTFKIYWHGLATDVEIKEDRITGLALGTVGPFNVGSKARLAGAASQDPSVPSVALCTQGPTHVLAGDWHLAKTVKVDAYPYEKAGWSTIKVKATDKQVSDKVRPDKVPGAKSKGQKARPLAKDELSALKGYKEGALKKSLGGRFKGSPLDSLFTDPADVQ